MRPHLRGNAVEAGEGWIGGSLWVALLSLPSDMRVAALGVKQAVAVLDVHVGAVNHSDGYRCPAYLLAVLLSLALVFVTQLVHDDSQH